MVWLSLGELGQQADLDPLLTLLTLPVQIADSGAPPSSALRSSYDADRTASHTLHRGTHGVRRHSHRPAAPHPRRPGPSGSGRHEGEARGRQEGEAQGEARGRAAEAAAVTLRLLNRRCGPLSEATTARIQALPLEQLEGLA
ncbi:MAG: DUF4351 domain-containing protein, partial [Synechococcus sp.]